MGTGSERRCASVVLDSELKYTAWRGSQTLARTVPNRPTAGLYRQAGEVLDRSSGLQLGCPASFGLVLLAQPASRWLPMGHRELLTGLTWADACSSDPGYHESRRPSWTSRRLAQSGQSAHRAAGLASLRR